jgi:sigma-54 specific flagellar transcriptional regulator A
MERCSILTVTDEIELKDLPRKIQMLGPVQPAPRPESAAPTLANLALDDLDVEQGGLKGQLELLESRLIREALDKSDGVVAQAAQRLGLRRTTLVEKIRKFGIERATGCVETLTASG